jgi:hypothetical protein
MNEKLHFELKNYQQNYSKVLKSKRLPCILILHMNINKKFADSPLKNFKYQEKII